MTKSEVYEWNKSKELYKERLFNIKLKPELDNLINKALLSINIYPNSINYDDISQECFVKIHTILSDKKKLNQIKNIDNYLFILIRNTALNYLIKSSRYIKFKRRVLEQLKIFCPIYNE